jgi:hypothetical protein
MQTSKGTPARVTIPIQVQTQDSAKSGARRGTFTSPWPKVVVRMKDLVRWQITPGETFVLQFIPCEGTAARSPFKKARVTEKDGFLDVVNRGHFHYRVKVTHADGRAKSTIKHCPEFEVGN